jgi:MAM domain, meprin/A5/mu
MGIGQFIGSVRLDILRPYNQARLRYNTYLKVTPNQKMDFSSLFAGSFLYFNSAAVTEEPGLQAIISTALFKREKEGEPRCLRFWYFFSGHDMGYLQVTTDPTANQSEPILWKSQGEATAVWTQGSVTIPDNVILKDSFNGQFQ